MTKTVNCNLNQWEATDPIRRADFNADNAAIDAALAEKAEKSAVTAVESALNSYKTSNNAAVAAVSAALGSGGSNCRIATGSYVGDGTYGPDNPTSLTFPFVPTWVMIAECGMGINTAPAEANICFLLRPMQGATSTYTKALQVTWSGKSVSWYCKSTVSNAQMAQNNNESYTYYWIALGAA